MPKELGRNGNGEGSVYNTIQKIDRKKIEAQIQTKTYVKKNGIVIIEIVKK